MLQSSGRRTPLLARPLSAATTTGTSSNLSERRAADPAALAEWKRRAGERALAAASRRRLARFTEAERAEKTNASIATVANTNNDTNRNIHSHQDAAPATTASMPSRFTARAVPQQQLRGHRHVDAMAPLDGAPHASPMMLRIGNSISVSARSSPNTGTNRHGHFSASPQEQQQQQRRTFAPAESRVAGPAARRRAALLDRVNNRVLFGDTPPAPAAAQSLPARGTSRPKRVSITGNSAVTFCIQDRVCDTTASPPPPPPPAVRRAPLATQAANAAMPCALPPSLLVVVGGDVGERPPTPHPKAPPKPVAVVRVSLRDGIAPASVQTQRARTTRLVI